MSFWTEYLANRGVCYTNDPNSNPNPNPGGDPSPNNPQQGTKPWEKEFGSTFDPDRAWQALENARRAERDAKRDADKHAKTIKDKEDAEKTELEKATGKLTEMENKLAEYQRKEREAVARSAVAEEARKEGALYPEDIYALIAGDLEVDDEGKPKNAAVAVKTFKSSRPNLFQAVRVNGKDDSSKRTNEQVKTGEFDRTVRGMFGRGRE